MSQADGALLAAEGLYLRRSGRELFDGLGLSLHRGQLLWLRGPNGSGKTSLMRVLSGLLAPDAGSLRWRGGDFASRVDERGPAIAVLDDRLGLSRELSVAENLAYFAQINGRAPDPAILERLQLQRLAHAPVRQLSLGQQKRAGLARLMNSGAALWLLDEPFNALDQPSRDALRQELRSRLEQGIAIMIASHESLALGDVPVTELELACPA